MDQPSYFSVHWKVKWRGIKGKLSTTEIGQITCILSKYRLSQLFDYVD